MKKSYTKLLQEIRQDDVNVTNNITHDILKLSNLLVSLRASVKTQISQINDIQKLHGLYQEISPDQLFRDDELRKRNIANGNYQIRLECSISGILATAYQQAESDMTAIGYPRPCDYAVVALGSVALQQATPYSDLEFIIVTGDKLNESTRKYFINLTELVKFRFECLNEPYNKMSPPQPIGVTFDATHTPVGRCGDHQIELIGDINYFIERLNQYNPDLLLRSMLEVPRFVYGSHDIFDVYRRKIHEQLKQDYENSRYTSNMFVNRFVQMLTQDRGTSTENRSILNQMYDSIGLIDNFCSSDGCTLLDIKQNIYRFTDRALYTYAGKNGWFQESVFQLYHRLHDNRAQFSTISSNCMEACFIPMILFALKLKILYHLYYRARSNPEAREKNERYNINKDFINYCKDNHNFDLIGQLREYCSNASSFFNWICDELLQQGNIQIVSYTEQISGGESEPTTSSREMPEGNDTQGLQRSSPCNTPMLFYRYHDGTQCSSLTACVHDNPEFKDPDVSRGRYRPTVQKDGNIIYWDVESWEDRHPGHGARDLKYGIRRPIP